MTRVYYKNDLLCLFMDKKIYENIFFLIFKKLMVHHAIYFACVAIFANTLIFCGVNIIHVCAMEKYFWKTPRLSRNGVRSQNKLVQIREQYF